MKTTLTERYIAQAVKNLPLDAQGDVRAELEASITDAVEARLEQGEEHPAAERAVLTELGDPGILAADYADRPLHLIGPKFYLTWWRLLKLLLWIVPPIAFIGVGFGQMIAGASIGTVFGQAIAVGLSSIVHIAFWVTLVFAILDRAGADTGMKWDVDQLPEPPETGTGCVDMIASLIFLVLAAAAVLWDSLIGFVWIDGVAFSVLNPALWPWWMSALFALTAAEAIFAIALFVRRRWSTALAVINTALAVAFISWGLTLLVRGDLFNPEMIDAVVAVSGVEQDVLRILAILIGFGIVGFPIWDIIDGWLKRSRDARRK